MSENKEAKLKIIQGNKEEISDQEFELFLKALLGPYNSGGYLPE